MLYQGDVVVDIGGNAGLYIINRQFGRGLKVRSGALSQPISYERLLMNMKENYKNNMKTFKKAVALKNKNRDSRSTAV